MTARPVNRTVLGSNGQLGIGESIMLQEKARYEEFRRQHAKQNRDLVRVNTQRLEEIQSLKAEKDGLQAIILEERAEKAALASELKTLKKELAQVRSNSTREALDAILAVVPTLRQLREKLDTSSANSLERKRFDSVNRYVRVDPYEDRQFVAASGQTNLADLTERTERETDSDCGSTPGVLEHRIARSRSISASPQRHRLDLTVNRRRSVTAQERPMPPVRAEEAPAYTIPIPLQVEDQPAMPPRNRRISATKTPRASSISPETAAPVTPIVAMVETAVADVISATNPLITTTKRQRTSSAAATHVNPQTSSLLRPGKVESTENIRPRTSISAMVTLPPAKGKEEEVDLDGMEPTQSEKQDQWNPSSTRQGERTEHESTLINMAGRKSVESTDANEANVDEDEDGENGGRQTRRARKSVNYKEPSLHTKMRKPDGKLAIPPTSATKARTPSRHRSQSTETPTPTPHMNIPAPNFAESASTKEKDEGLTGLMRLQEKMARKEIAHQVELTQAAVRRKSVLPKSGRDGIPVRNSGKVTSLASEKRATPMYSEGSDGIATKKEIILEETINPAAQAEFTNLESTSSRRRLAQLSINTVSPGEERVHAARQITESKTAGGWKDSEPKAGDENATDSSTQKARLGRRRSSLFRPSEM